MDITKGDLPVLMPPPDKGLQHLTVFDKTTVVRDHNARADKLADRVYPVCRFCFTIITRDLQEHERDCAKEHAYHP